VLEAILFLQTLKDRQTNRPAKGPYRRLWEHQKSLSPYFTLDTYKLHKGNSQSATETEKVLGFEHKYITKSKTVNQSANNVKLAYNFRLR
jgi:hypothetical protein